MSATWTSAVEPDGTISSLQMELAFDSGAADGAGGTNDLGMAIQFSDNCYYTRDFACTGSIFHSSRVGNTSVRAPGVIQSVALRDFVFEVAAARARFVCQA